MKVAVSLPDALFQQADEVASSLGLNRSQLYARALEQFIGLQGADPVTAKLDELADEFGSGAGSELGRRLIDSGDWAW